MKLGSIPHPHRLVVGVQQELILDTRLSLAAKGLYGAVLLEPLCSASHLSSVLGISRETVSRRLQELREAGWATRPGSRIVCPCQPNEVRERQADLFRLRLPYHRYMGEHLSFTWLDELVDCDDYVDHARPPFLRNPKTTEKYPDLNKAREQELRDWAKRGMSEANGIQLVTITWEDLSLQGMLAKIPDRLPKRQADPKDPFIRCLEQESAKYRASMERIKEDQYRIG